NAIDHGIEPMAARRQAGKPPTGRVTVAATLRGSRVEITVSDDGKGLDLAALRGQLAKKGLAVPDDDRDLRDCIFVAGVSTSRAVTRVSGRGVGLDVVKAKVVAMRGTVDVAFEPGRGTRFTLSLPLTLTSLRAVLLGAGGQIFAADSMSVRKVLRVGR